MKKIARSIAAGIIIIAVSFTNANAQKIAHINLDSLISLLPEFKKAQQDIQDYGKQLGQQITAMQTELQSKADEYKQKSKDLAEVVRAEKEKELNDLNQRIQDFQQQAQLDYQKKSAALTKPVYDKAKKVIDQVAKENNYKYVLDTSGNNVIYFDNSDDILGIVIKKLSVTPPSAVPAPSK